MGKPPFFVWKITTFSFSVGFIRWLHPLVHPSGPKSAWGQHSHYWMAQLYQEFPQTCFLKAENHGISLRSCGSSRCLPEILWLQPLRSGSRSADEDRRWRWGRRIESHAGPVGGPGETAGSVMEILEDSRFRHLGVQVIFAPQKRLWALVNGDMRGPFEWRYFCHITYPKQDCLQAMVGTVEFLFRLEPSAM